MHFIKGINALSDFRKTKTLNRLQAIDKNIVGIEAEYIHIVDTLTPLKAEEQKRLKDLATYGTSFTGERRGQLYLVVPRPGTISPWSSKATDIIHNCGLTSVNRIERGTAYYVEGAQPNDPAVAAVLYDRMTETVLLGLEQTNLLFEATSPRSLTTIDLIKKGEVALSQANRELGLALTDDEISYLFRSFKALGRNPSDVELMMFAQINSEHCRHKVFNAKWKVDDKLQPKSLFKMIKNTFEKNSEGILSAYSDNAAVIKGSPGGRFFSEQDKQYSYHNEDIHLVAKVETHNHPTAIAPVPGAATGIGGEIRDEAATGRGAKSKMGLAGFSVSNLNIPDSIRPWEKPYGKPSRIASPLDIMLEAPIGGAGFANEFGRPNVLGYFRTYEEQLGESAWGYHKPIMIAGGLGNIRPEHVLKQQLTPGALIIVLGGPSMLIGLGGGAASSMETGASEESLDFASVQRGNGEIERRAQEVIDACWAQGDQNPIISIHDVGAGGLSNALPELIHDSGRGGVFELRDIPSAEPGLSPLEIWCNESQERYVIAVSPDDIESFKEICERERCPFAVVGVATAEQNLVVNDSLFNNQPINLPLEVLFGNPPKMVREYQSKNIALDSLDLSNIKLEEAVERVLKLPAVSSKKFLITIGDRTVGGLVTRDQMVGPWQVPVSDAAVSASGFDVDSGEAMAMGERTPLALIDAPAAARMAIAETITNIACSDIAKLSDIKLSANWMAAVGHENEDQHLFESVKAVGEDFCPELGLTIPVGKDSLSMRTTWQEGEVKKAVTSPVSLIITGFSQVKDVSKTLTPQLNLSEPSQLVLIDLSEGNYRLGGSALAQVYNQVGNIGPDVSAENLRDFFKTLTKLKNNGQILAYHDRSDGGLLTTLLEMAFTSRSGLAIDLSTLNGSPLEKLFNEELGVIVQVKNTDLNTVLNAFNGSAFAIGQPSPAGEIVIKDGPKTIYKNKRSVLESWWSETSYQIQKLRDNPETADSEFAIVKDEKDPGLSATLSFELSNKTYKARPKVAIFREQGVNGQVEMAAAFDKAGFTSIDLHLNDIMAGSANLDDFVGLVACGGFSYGDVLGAGEGWAKSILFNDNLRTMFTNFFERQDTFSLGVCNGCQVLAALKELIPGADSWPSFQRNTSEQFEARVVMTEINDSPSILFKGMGGSHLPIPTAHGEGRAVFSSELDMQQAKQSNLVVMRYIDNQGKITEKYPYNPNGSGEGITALTSSDGRATIIMPHPERVFKSRSLSWHPPEWGEMSPWFKIFENAREWVENS